jgi:NAD(P)-dependent dehydrogenase (short-subunit alcohol dehydrogenase family)
MLGVDSSTPRAVLITGAAGGIGQALCAGFIAAGWHVLATDHPAVIAQRSTSAAQPPALHWIPLDLAAFAQDTVRRQSFATRVRSLLASLAPAPCSLPLACLVNNAAVQRLGRAKDVTAEDWEASLDVNLVAPFLLAQTFLPELEAARGSVVNIASIHAQLTKPGFVVYATTKAALVGMTRALAVDLGPRVRVNAICPAAISTLMLEAGFAGRPEARRQLDEFHPAGCIGQPAEVARLAVFLAEANAPFLTGSCLSLDGAISARLHDPV